MERIRLSHLLLTSAFAVAAANFIRPTTVPDTTPEPLKPLPEAIQRLDERQEEIESLKRASRLIELQSRFGPG